MTGGAARPPDCFTCNSIINIIGNSLVRTGCMVNEPVGFTHCSKPKEPNPRKLRPLTRSEAARLNGQRGGRPRKSRDVSAGESTERPQATDRADDPAFALTANPFGLTAREQRFVEAYVADPNAHAAYKLAHPRCSDRTAYTNGAAVLRKTHIQQALDAERRAQWVRRQMDGDEALARIANVARGDIGDVLPESDRLKLLPEDVRRRIKSIRETKYGREIVLYDALHANEVIAKATGKLKETVRVENLEDIMARANQLAREQAVSGAAS